MKKLKIVIITIIVIIVILILSSALLKSVGIYHSPATFEKGVVGQQFFLGYKQFRGCNFDSGCTYINTPIINLFNKSLGNCETFLTYWEYRDGSKHDGYFIRCPQSDKVFNSDIITDKVTLQKYNYIIPTEYGVSVPAKKK